MQENAPTQGFLQGTLGRTGRPVFRLGLSATYRPGRRAIYDALDEGVNYFFAYGFDSQMMSVMREARAEGAIVATGAYNYLWWRQDPRRTLEKRLRQLGADTLDVFLFLGVMKREHLPDSVLEQMIRLREEGKTRAIGISCHDRALAGELCARGAIDVAMVRYNAAHPGAERDIFPHLAAHDPGVVSYTATRWRYLMRRPRGWTEAVPDAGMAYRFVLSNPHVDVALTAPADGVQLQENLDAVRRGPLDPDEMAFMRRFGAAVHAQAGWFM